MKPSSLDTNPILQKQRESKTAWGSLHYLEAILLFDQTRIIFQNIFYYTQSKMIFETPAICQVLC